jgi:hypothetical protein
MRCRRGVARRDACARAGEGRRGHVGARARDDAGGGGVKAAVRAAREPRRARTRPRRSEASCAHERQANTAAAGFLRGDSHLARGLTMAPAADFRLGGSPGQPLGSPLRMELERAFSADLGAVRLHHDAAAGEAVRAQGARAFASGADIYLAPGAFEPGSLAGRSLLAHEVSHTLQQTGRSSLEGRVAATRASGGRGQVQRQPNPDDPFGDDKVKWMSDGKKAFPTLVARHSKAPSADPTLAKMIEVVKDRFGEDLPHNFSSILAEGLRVVAEDGFFIEKIAGASDVKHVLTMPAMGFLVDCLKVAATDEDFAAAAKLLDKDTKFEIRSAFGPRTAFRKYLDDKRGEDWIAGAFAYGPIAGIWWGTFLNTFEQYVLNPGRPRQTLYNYKETREKERANIDGDKEELLASDRAVLAIELLGRYDDERMAMLKFLDDALAKAKLSGGLPQDRSAAAALLGEILARKRAASRSKAWGEMLGRMQDVAVAAAGFWREVGELRTSYQRLMAKPGFDVYAGIDAGMKRIFASDNATFKPLRDALKSAAVAGGIYFFDADGARAPVPAPAEYARRLGVFADRLGIRANPQGNVLLTLQMELVKQAHASTQSLQEDQAKAIGLAIWWLLDLKGVLEWYRPAEDRDAAKGYTDRRLRHRLDVAEMLGNFSQVAGWADSLADARKVAYVEDSGRSELLVKGHWRVAEAPIDQLQKDATTPIALGGGNAKVTPHQLAVFFHIDVLRQLRTAVGTVLDVARKGGKLDLEAANKKIEELRRPWRCEPEEGVLRINPKESASGITAGETLSAHTLIKRSPKSVAELGELAKMKHLGAGWDWLARSENLELFAWIVPDLALYPNYLKTLEPFATWMKEEGFASLTGYDWLEKLSAVLAKKKAGGVLNDEIEAVMQREAATEQEELVKTYRAFTAVNRRQVRDHLTGLLKKYDYTSRTMFVPRESVKIIDMFAVAVAPALDSSVQTSLLMLSLADQLDSSFDSVRHSTRVPPLLHYTLIKAVEFADTELKAALSGDAKMKAALEVMLHRNPLKPAEDEQLADFDGKSAKLAEVARRIEEGMKAIQEDQGFSSDGQNLKSLNWYPEIVPGRKGAFEMRGEDWELVKVHRAFTYHPALTTAAVTSKTATPILKNEKGEPEEIKHEILVEFLRNGVEYEVYADDEKGLAALSEAIFYEGLSREMENLAEGIETGVMILMDIIELIPGIGQEVMLARIGAQTTAFVIGELPTIADAVKKDPVEFVTRIANDLATKYLTLDGLITFVLLGQGIKSGGDSAPFESERRMAPSKTSTRNPVKGKLARVISILRRLGIRLWNAVQWLQLRMAGPIRALQSSVVTRPKLGWLLRRGIDIGLWLRDIIPPDLVDPAQGKDERKLGALEDLMPAGQEVPEDKKNPADREAHSRGILDTIKADVAQQGREFKVQFEDKLELLREAHLPGEIVPLEPLVGFIIDFFLMRLGAKVRLLKTALQHTPPYQDLMSKINSALADQARGTAVDPNVYWRKYILSGIENQFVEARNGLVDSMYGLSDRVASETGIQEFRLERPAKRSPSEFKMVEAPFPQEEVDLARIEGAVPAIAGLGKLPATPGQPLAARVRAVEERRFRHDFGHVRMHRDEESSRTLADAGARGLTSGSHIFLRPGLDPERGPGARVLRHELTHVLQQTGERPLGGKHEQKPVRGRAARGLRVDHLREAAAEAMARADSSVAREPIVVDEGAEGMQPDLENVAIDMLRKFTELHSAAEFEKASGTAKIPGEADAGAAWIVIKNRLLKPLESDFLPFSWPVAKHIAEHVTSFDLAHDLRGGAALAQKPLKGARGKRPKTELDFDRFVTLLEAVLFARTGIAMQIKIDNSGAMKVQSLKVGYVHLGLIPPGTPGKSPLWDKVMAETPEILAGEPDAEVRLELFQRLQSLGPEPFLWKTGEGKFKFSADFVEAFGKVRSKRKPELVKKLPKIGLAPDADPNVAVPLADEYLNPTGQSGVGLRIGKHGGFNKLPKQQGLDRESHHTTQYLLVQFFRNDNKRTAWQSGVPYSGKSAKYGIFPPTNPRSHFEAPSGRLKLADLDPGGAGNRGTEMPAILLSADLHKRGRLHVEKEGEWKGGQGGDPDSDDGQGRVTQGFAIQAEFKRQLKAHVGTYDTSPDWKNKMDTPDAADKVREAMLGTYHWMRSRMLEQLKVGLVTRELAYYRMLAARKPGVADPQTGKLASGHELKSDALLSVFERAKANNDAVMKSAGWTV